jgi:hypothetical protein
MYKVIKNADGTATVRRAFSGAVVGNHASMDEATAWIEAKDLADATAERAKDKGMNPRCHYCGLPTTQGACSECGTEI